MTTADYPFVTSELASVLVTLPNGGKEYVFVATPTMLFVIRRSEKPNQGYITKNVRRKIVRNYNKLIAKESDMIITKDKNINYKRLFA